MVRALPSFCFTVFEVLDQGKLVEYDAPYLLLHNCDSLFAQYVAQTGSENTKALLEIAGEAYINRFSV